MNNNERGRLTYNNMDFKRFKGNLGKSQSFL